MCLTSFCAAVDARDCARQGDPALHALNTADVFKANDRFNTK